MLYPDGILCTTDTEGHCSILCPEGAIYRSPSTAEMKSFQAYLASKSVTEERPKPPEEGTEAVGRTTSRVAFSGVQPGDGDDGGVDRVVAEEEDRVWVVSLPSGERYVWQKVGRPRQDRPPVQEVITEESTGQSEPLPGEDRETPTCSEVVMPLPPLGVNGSVDPVTKEVSLYHSHCSQLSKCMYVRMYGHMYHSNFNSYYILYTYHHLDLMIISFFLLSFTLY